MASSTVHVYIRATDGEGSFQMKAASYKIHRPWWWWLFGWLLGP